MDEQTTGVILRVFPLTETSVVVHWFSPDKGRIATVAKGARRPKSNFQGKLDLFHIAEFSFRRSRRSDLHVLREVALKETFPNLRKNIDLLSCLTEIVKLIARATEEQTPLPNEYLIFIELVRLLDKNRVMDHWPVIFRIKFLLIQGVEPDWEQSRLDLGTKSIAKKMTVSDWKSLAKLKPSDVQLDRLSQFLEGFIRRQNW
ncbi:MAG: DNA repair protein RecO [Verrucomicrobiota bacterium]|nr:DNA repair protein RecO [Verrucomicrobiota bacterium]